MPFRDDDEKGMFLSNPPVWLRLESLRENIARIVESAGDDISPLTALSVADDIIDLAKQHTQIEQEKTAKLQKLYHQIA